MCEMMGKTPDPANEPVEYDDFPLEVQSALEVYNLLHDTWEPMSGSYMGKDFASLPSIFQVLDIEKADQIFYLEMVRKIDDIRSEIYLAKQKQQQSSNKK